MAILIDNPLSGVGDASAAVVSVSQGERDCQAYCKEFWEASDLTPTGSASNSAFTWYGRKLNTPLTPAWTAAPTILTNAINTTLPAIRFISNAALIGPAGNGLLTPSADSSFIAICRTPNLTAGSGTIVGNQRAAGTPGFFAWQMTSTLDMRVYHESGAGGLEINQGSAFSVDTWYAFMLSYDQAAADLYVERSGTAIANNTSVGAEITGSTGGDVLLVGSAGSTGQAQAGNHDMAALYVFDVPLAHADYAVQRAAIEAHITAKFGLTIA
jgi:hypothetical protein